MAELADFIKRCHLRWTTNVLTYPKHLDIATVDNKENVVKYLESLDIPNKEYIIKHVRS